MSRPAFAWILLSLLAFTMPLTGQEAITAWLPQIGHGSGFSSEILLLNSGAEALQVELRAFDGTGQPMAVLAGDGAPVSVLTVSVPAGGSRVVKSAGDDGSLLLGWLQVEGQAAVQALLRISPEPGGPAVASVSVKPAPLALKGTVPVHQEGLVRTGLAVLSPPRSPGEASVVLKAVSEGGLLLAEEALSLQPGERWSGFLDEVFPEFGDFRGTLEFAAKFPVALLPLRQEGLLLSSLETAPERPDPTENDACGSFPRWTTSDFVLPFPPGTSYAVNQANCSGFGHSGFWRYGYDFIMPVGTPVSAARNGTVIFTSRNTPDGNFSGTNLITVLHSDGTVALYSHLTLNGVLVEPGERVAAGQVIGLSGNTGNTGGLPHLHFSLHPCASLPGLPGTVPCPTIPVTFRNTDPNPTGLERQRSYQAEEF